MNPLHRFTVEIYQMQQALYRGDIVELSRLIGHDLSNKQHPLVPFCRCDGCWQWNVEHGFAQSGGVEHRPIEDPERFLEGTWKLDE